MLRPEVIRKRLASLEQYITFLEKAQSYSLDEFVSTPEYYGSTERFLQLSIEAVNDIASHVISEMELGLIDQYKDIPEHFARENWINANLKDKWLKMIGFRNILVHDYLEIDREIVYEVLQNHLEDFRKLQQVMARFL